jgi:hypothetical protein
VGRVEQSRHEATTSLSAANYDAWTDRNTKNGISELMKGHILFQKNNGSHIFL